jgi:hypothetical protein
MEKHEFPASVAAIISEARRQQELSQQSTQKLNTAIGKLIAATDGLQGLVIEEVRSALINATAHAADEIAKPWRGATVDANKASTAFRHAAAMLPQRIFGMAAACVFLGIVAMVITAKLILPDWDELVALRQERADLLATVDVIKSKGTNVDLIQCRDTKNQQRLCARIEVDAGDSYYVLKRK